MRHPELESGSQRASFAFTLAEVLITLGVIGVVAVMTMPILVAKHRRDVLHKQFLKVYAELNQVSKKFEVDYGITIPEYTNSAQFYNNLFPSYYNGGRATNDWWYGTEDEEGKVDLKAMPYKLKPMKGNTEAHPMCDISGYKTDIAGRAYIFNDWPDSGKNGPILCVDINGPKAPNRYGMDYFLFVFTNDGYVIPMGQDHKNNQGNFVYGGGNFTVQAENNCHYSTNEGQAYACAYYALQNKHPLDDNKDYWTDFIGE